MDELLGFIVLTSPLFIIILLAILGIALAILVAKKLFHKGGIFKYIVGVAVCFLVVFLPFSGEITGRIYLSHLCKNETGTKIFSTVELPKEYWDNQGSPKFLYSSGVLNNKITSSDTCAEAELIANFVKTGNGSE